MIDQNRDGFIDKDDLHDMLASLGEEYQKTRPDTRHKMRLVCVLFTFKNNARPTDLRTDRRTDGPTDGHDLL